MLHLRAELRFYFRKHLKMHKNEEKKMLVIYLTVKSRGVLG